MRSEAYASDLIVCTPIYPPWWLPTERLFTFENIVKAHFKKSYAKTGVCSKNGLEHILPMR